MFRAMALPSEVLLPLASPAPTVLDSDNSATDDESQGVGESGSRRRGAGARGVLASGGLGVSGSIINLDDSFPDNFMNGSASDVLDESQEEAIRRSHVRPRVVWGVRDVLPAAPTIIRSPAVLPAGNDGMAVAGIMRATFGNVEVSRRIDWTRCLGADSSTGRGVDIISSALFRDPYSHSCQFIDIISSAPFYIGITECPERRLEEHDVAGTCGIDPSMFVLVEARTSRDTAALERLLLSRYRHFPVCHNVSSGGEGASWGSPHYLYVLLSQSPLIRRGRRR